MKLVTFNQSEELIKNAILSVNETADLREGSPIYESFVKPVTPINQAVMDEVNEINASLSLAKIKTSIDNNENVDDLIDEKATDFFITRREGGSASGYVRCFLSEPANITLTEGEYFTTESGLRFILTSNRNITASQFYNYDNTEKMYYVDIFAIAEETGDEYAVAENTITYFEGAVEFDKVTNPNKFTGVNIKKRESNLELYERMKENVGVKTLLENSSAKNILLEDFNNLIDVRVINGVMDFSMRSKMKIFDYSTYGNLYTAIQDIINDSTITNKPIAIKKAIDDNLITVRTPNKVDYFCKNAELETDSILLDMPKETLRGNIRTVRDSLLRKFSFGKIRVTLTKNFTTTKLTGTTPGQYTSGLLSHSNIVFNDSGARYYRGFFSQNDPANYFPFNTTRKNIYIDNTGTGETNPFYLDPEGRFFFDLLVVSWEPDSTVGGNIGYSSIYNKPEGTIMQFDAAASGYLTGIANPNIITNNTGVMGATDIDLTSIYDSSVDPDETTTASHIYSIEVSPEGINFGNSGDFLFLNINRHRYFLQNKPVANADNDAELFFGYNYAESFPKYICCMFATDEPCLLKEIDLYFNIAKENLKYWIADAEVYLDEFSLEEKYVPAFSATQYLYAGITLSPNQDDWCQLFFNDLQLEGGKNYFLILSTSDLEFSIGLTYDNKDSETDKKEIQNILGPKCLINGPVTTNTRILTADPILKGNLPERTDWKLFSYTPAGDTEDRHISFKMDIFNTIVKGPFLGIKEVGEITPGLATSEDIASLPVLRSYSILRDTELGYKQGAEFDYLPSDCYEAGKSANDIFFPSPVAFTFSVRNDIHLRMPEYDENELPASLFNTKNLKLTYYYGGDFSNIQKYLEDPEKPTSAFDPLVYHFWPVFIDGYLKYRGNADEQTVADYIKNKINYNQLVSVSTLINNLYVDLELTFIDLPFNLIAEAHFPDGGKTQVVIKNKMPALSHLQTFIAREVFAVKI